MSTVISFQGEDDWFKANWVVRKFFEDVRKRFQLSAEDNYELNQGIALNGMHFTLMEPDMRKRIMHMLKVTALDLVNDNEGKYRGDYSEDQYELYRSSFPSLLELIDKYENADWPPEEE